MEKILKIKLDRIGVYQTTLGEIVVNPDILENGKEHSERFVEIFGRTIRETLNKTYGYPNGNQDYNLVLLTDDELNELERKSKQ